MRLTTSFSEKFLLTTWPSDIRTTDIVARGVSCCSAPPCLPFTILPLSAGLAAALELMALPPATVERVAPGTRCESQRTETSSTVILRPPS